MLAKYSNFIDKFSKKLHAKLPKHLHINKNVINLDISK